MKPMQPSYEELVLALIEVQRVLADQRGDEAEIDDLLENHVDWNLDALGLDGCRRSEKFNRAMLALADPHSPSRNPGAYDGFEVPPLLWRTCSCGVLYCPMNLGEGNCPGCRAERTPA